MSQQYGNPPFNNSVSNRVLLQQQVQGPTVPYGYAQQPLVPQAIVVTNQPRYMPDVQYSPPKENAPAKLTSSFYEQEPPQQLYDQDQHPPSKQERLVNWIHYALPIAFFILSLFLASQLLYIHQNALQNIGDDKGILQHLIINLKKDLISDIKVVDIPPPTTTPATPAAAAGGHHRHHLQILAHLQNQKHADEPQCPAGYTQTNVGEWKGVNSGCLCDDGTIHNRAYCTFHSGTNCQYVSEQSPVNYGVWKSQKFCVKKVKDWYFSGTADCKSGYKRCSGGICVNTNEDCAISALTQVSNPTPTDVVVTIDAVKYKVTRNTDQQPYVELTVVPGAQQAACYNKDVAPFFQSNKFYPLAKQPEKGCSEQIKQYSTAFTTQPVPEFNDKEGLTAKFNQIPFYKATIVATDTQNLQIIQRFKIAANKVCDDLNADNFDQVLTKSQRLFSLIRWVSITVIVLSIVGLALTVILYVLRGRKLDAFNVEKIQQTKVLYVFALVVAFFLILLGAIYLNHVDTQGGLKDLHVKFQNYLTAECFSADKPIHRAVQSVDTFSSNTYLSTENWVKTAFAFGIVFVVVAFILTALQHFGYREPWCLDPWKTI